MADTTPSFDPERLKRERHDVDLGSETETGYDKVGGSDNSPPPADDPVSHPTAGVTPPAR